MEIQDAVGYVRFSSAIQEKGTSIRRQRKMIDDWCAKRPEVRLHNIYTDDGKSAWNKSKQAERKAFEQMKEDRAHNRIPKPIYLLVEDASRLSRLDFTEAVAQMKHLIDELGFVVVFLTGNGGAGKEYNSTNFREIGDHITFMIEAQTHNTASEQKSKHSRANWKQLREDAAKTGKVITRACARWCTPVDVGQGDLNASGEPTSFKLNEHAATVSRIFNMRLAGDSMNNIAQTLNFENIPTLTGKIGAWNQTSVHGILNNRAVIGEYVPSRKVVVEGIEPIKDYYPAISGVTLVEFTKVQEMREGKGRTSESDNPTNINLFKGVLKCVCGGAIISSTVTPLRYGYYTCSMYRLKRCTEFPEQKIEGGKGKGSRGKGNSISRQLVDELLVKGFLYNLPKLFQGSNVEQSQLNYLETELSAIEQELSNIEDNMSLMKASPRMIKRYEDTEARLSDKQKEIDELKSRMITAVNIDTVDALDLMTKEGRQECNLIAKKYIKEIRLNMKKKVCDIILHTGYRFNNYPLYREDFDGASWVHFFLQLGEREYTFTGTEDISSGLEGRLTEYPIVKDTGSDGGKGYDDNWPEVEPDYPNTKD